MAVAELIEQIDKLTVLELADLVKQLEEKYGVSAAAPVAMMAAAPGAAQPRRRPRRPSSTSFCPRSAPRRSRSSRRSASSRASGSPKLRRSSKARPRPSKRASLKTKPSRSRRSSRKPAPKWRSSNAAIRTRVRRVGATAAARHRSCDPRRIAMVRPQTNQRDAHVDHADCSLRLDGVGDLRQPISWSRLPPFEIALGLIVGAGLPASRSESCAECTPTCARPTGEA